jgi:predicted transcriptional regulator
MNDALISIKPKHVARILSGVKSVEIRNRSVHLSAGTRLWIYSTLPMGQIEAVATVQLIMTDTPDAIWHHCSAQIGVSQSAFLSYVNGSGEISAIFLKCIRRLYPPIPLSTLRSQIWDFHPPQFVKKIEPFHPLLDILIRRRQISS